MVKKKEDKQKSTKTKDKVKVKAPTSLDVAKKNIIKKYGAVISTMADRASTKLRTVSTGSLGLDMALSNGGMALGRVYEVYGHPSGGKTTLTMSIIAQAQKQGLKCLFVDAEHAAAPKLFEAMGVDNVALDSIAAYTGEENLDALEQLMKTGEYQVAIIDSVSSLIPSAESDAEMGDQFMGLLARLMSKAMRKFVPLAQRTQTLIIFINQVRSKIGVYGNPETTTGGVALDFNATGRINVEGGETKSSLIIDTATGEVLGHNVKFSVKKNKLGKPRKKASVPLIYGIGYDVHWEVLNLSVDFGLLEKSGAWYAYEGKNIAQGELNAKEYLKENPDIYNKLRKEIIEMTGLSEFYDE